MQNIKETDMINKLITQIKKAILIAMLALIISTAIII